MEEGASELKHPPVPNAEPIYINQELVRRYAAQLGLSEWKISVSSEVRADCTAETDINEQARIATIYPGDTWDAGEERETILHELTHLVLADLVWGIDQVIERRVRKSEREMAEIFIDQEVETVCERLSRVLVKHLKEDE